ncbi:MULTISPECIES: LLM class flavin-dependent oxidoreductase [Salipiger]|jgi:luciferase family oxidoreductase group 1|uniref:LLM class flavin-dependent oxidoreductase n=1 Tax=Salipiger TaxID=263377 RepID=UPI0008EEB12C|nr:MULTISPECIES: LLM class flavin-dependent oxidoreductase [Salipiger]SFD84355.1 luciferase family oxidoreductase, group 1 [Salipiger profundus]
MLQNTPASPTSIPVSVLDLSPVPEGHTTAEALRNTIELARHTERLGYHRYWLAEHHNMPGIASAATSVVIGQVAAATSRIRVGAGGIMLPNHSPLVIAEQFGTLATMFPDRIDLGLGRAPGSDQITAMALRRNHASGDRFPEDVVELLGLFGDAAEGQPVRAVPGEGTHVPVWILGSSLFGAQLAAHLGLPYAFASHFAPDALEQAIQIYRERFEPGITDKPHFMLAANVWAADTEEEALRLKSSQQQQFIRLRTGAPGKMPRPVDDIAAVTDPRYLEMANRALSISATGDRAQVARGLSSLIERYAPDELILSSAMHDPAARLRSHEIAMEALQGEALAEHARR